MGQMNKSPNSNRKERFIEALKKALKAAGDPASYRYDKQHNCLVAQGNATKALIIENAYHQYYEAEPRRRPDVLRKFVRAFLAPIHNQVPQVFEDAQHDLLPVIHSRDKFHLEIVPGGIAPALPYDPLAEHLGVGLSFCLHHSILQVDDALLTHWGTTFAHALSIAKANLVTMSKASMKQYRPGLWVSCWNDNYDASRLILTDFIRGHAVKGEHVAMVPKRDTLLVTGSEETNGLKQLISLGKEAMKKPYRISGLPVLLQGNTWVPFRPKPGHPLYYEVRSLAANSCYQNYAAQKALLEAQFATEGKDIFVASYNILEDPASGQKCSITVWTMGISSALPQADYVAFVPMDEQGQPCSPEYYLWDDVCKTMGGDMKPMNLNPERYLVERFPTPQELATIRSDQNARGLSDAFLKKMSETTAPFVGKT